VTQRHDRAPQGSGQPPYRCPKYQDNLSYILNNWRRQRLIGPVTIPDQYTHGHQESVLRSHRWRTAENSAGYLLPALAPGQRLLDVGCGPGTITIDLAARVAPGEVIGLDRSEGVIEQAREAARASEATNVSFRTGDIYALDYEDASFDVVHAHQVLQHLTDPVAALRELRRVARPGGLVAVRDADYAAMTWHPPSPGLDD